MAETDPCGRCGKPFPDGSEPDPHGWCAACFAQVVRASTMAAIVPGVVAAALYFWMIQRFGLLESRFVVVFIALGLVLSWLAFKVGRRVAFDVIRVRRVRDARP